MSENRSVYVRKGAENSWTPDRVETLSRLWQEGQSARQIGEALGLSRNAIIGKIQRLVLYRAPELTAANKSKGMQAALAVVNGKRASRLTRPHESKAPKPKLVVHGNRQVHEAPEARPPRSELAQAAFAVDGNPTARPWLERPPRTCQWPLNGPDGETWSCCAPTQATYCDKHRAIGTVAARPWNAKSRVRQVAA